MYFYYILKKKVDNLFNITTCTPFALSSKIWPFWDCFCRHKLIGFVDQYVFINVHEFFSQNSKFVYSFESPSLTLVQGTSCPLYRAYTLLASILKSTLYQTFLKCRCLFGRSNWVRCSLLIMMEWYVKTYLIDTKISTATQRSMLNFCHRIEEWLGVQHLCTYLSWMKGF